VIYFTLHRNVDTPSENKARLIIAEVLDKTNMHFKLIKGKFDDS
jgi:hypothetical protein